MGPPLEGAALKAAVVNSGRINEGAFSFDAWSWGEKDSRRSIRVSGKKREMQAEGLHKASRP